MTKQSPKDSSLEFETKRASRAKKRRFLDLFIPIILTIFFSAIAIFTGYKTMLLSEEIKTLIFFSVTSMFILGYIFRERTYGRGVIVCVLCMENPLAISFGFALIYFFSGFTAWGYFRGEEFHVFVSLIFLIVGIAFLFKGFKEGPAYGWFA